MIKVQRTKIQAIEDAISEAVLSSTTMANDTIAHPKVPPKILTSAAMLAIHAVVMDLYGPNDVACPSDIIHLTKET